MTLDYSGLHFRISNCRNLVSFLFELHSLFSPLLRISLLFPLLLHISLSFPLLLLVSLSFPLLLRISLSFPLLLRITLFTYHISFSHSLFLYLLPFLLRIYGRFSPNFTIWYSYMSFGLLHNNNNLLIFYNIDKFLDLSSYEILCLFVYENLFNFWSPGVVFFHLLTS